MKPSTKQGFFQAFAVSVYITLVGLFMWNADKVFGKMNNFSGPILVLMLFSTSALICGLLVFYNPYKLFLAGKKKEAVAVVISTATWLFGILAVFLLSLLILK